MAERNRVCLACRFIADRYPQINRFAAFAAGGQSSEWGPYRGQLTSHWF
jgi:hypothetical protein